jgi:Tfp pilus assembly protein FimT
MRRKIKRIGKYLYALIYIFINSCAQQIPPTGGEKDEIPPKVIGTKPINKTSNFKDKRITLEFDEYIQIKENKNIIISPKPRTKTQIISDGKRLIFEFKEDDLDSNTTYNVSLINAIADIHEGKTLSEYQFVFSTGEDIDTNEITGEIINSISRQPEKDYTVVLSKYPLNKDSSFYKKNTAYITKSNENGNFSLKNLPNDSFELFAFNDKNNNNSFDKAEEIAFVNNALSSNQSNKTKLISFQQDEYAQDQLIDTIKLNTFIHQFVVFNHTNLKISKPNSIEHFIKIYKSNNHFDTITVYNIFNSDTVGSSQYILTNQEGKSDTLKIAGKKTKDKKLEKIELIIKPLIKPEDSIYIISNLPIKHIDISRFRLKLDTTIIDSIKLLKKDDFTMVVTNSLNPEKTYQLEIKDSSTQSIYNQYNTEKSQLIIPKKKEDFGGIQIENNATNDSTILIQIVDSKEINRIIYSNYLNNKTYKIEHLPPGTYKIRFIQDSNRNSQWDNGNINMLTQPEEIVYLKDEITIKAYWDIEIVLKKIDIIFN